VRVWKIIGGKSLEQAAKNSEEKFEGQISKKVGSIKQALLVRMPDKIVGL
jgi:hypothetical protein